MWNHDSKNSHHPESHSTEPTPDRTTCKRTHVQPFHGVQNSYSTAKCHSELTQHGIHATSKHVARNSTWKDFTGGRKTSCRTHTTPNHVTRNPHHRHPSLDRTTRQITTPHRNTPHGTHSVEIPRSTEPHKTEPHHTETHHTETHHTETRHTEPTA